MAWLLMYEARNLLNLIVEPGSRTRVEFMHITPFFKVVLERERHIERGKYCVLSREVSARLDAGCKEVLVNFTKITVTVNSNNFLQPW